MPQELHFLQKWTCQKLWKTNFSNLLCHVFSFLISSFWMCLCNLVICWHWEVAIFLLLCFITIIIIYKKHITDPKSCVSVSLVALQWVGNFAAFVAKSHILIRKPLEMLLNFKFWKCLFLTLHIAFEPKIGQWIIEENTATRIPKFAMVVFPSFVTSVFS